jgi:hypothetical protein
MSDKNSLLPQMLQRAILDNWAAYSNHFMGFESDYLANLNKNYKSIDNAYLALIFVKRVHQEILRFREQDLNSDISLEHFWDNHERVQQEKLTIMEISKISGLPKETARRKLLYLIKNKFLAKKGNIITWTPDEEFKKNYFQSVEYYSTLFSQLLKNAAKYINIDLDVEVIKQDIKKKFSFYMFHFLDVQQRYLKLFLDKLGDLELFFIGLQVIIVTAIRLKEKNYSMNDFFKNPDLVKDYQQYDISATSISDVTGIPRATCIRKLDQLAKLKIVQQNKITKRYYILPELFGKFLNKEQATKVAEMFSNFYSLFIKTLRQN